MAGFNHTWWIGLSVQGDEWRWSDCTVFEDDNFTTNGTENCAVLGGGADSLWAAECTEMNYFICEISENDKRPVSFQGSPLSTSNARLWWTPSVEYTCDVAGYRIIYMPSDSQFPVYDTEEIFDPEISEIFLERLTSSTNYSVTIGIITADLFLLPTTAHSKPIYIKTYPEKPDDLEGTPPIKVCSAANTDLTLKENSTLHIVSPGYPSNYGDYEDCLWIIRRNSEDTLIKITYQDFNTEEGYDQVTIGIGSDSNDKDAWLDISSGNIPFTTLSVNADMVFVKFNSDGSKSESFNGFLLDFESVTIENIESVKAAVTTQATATCGSTLILDPFMSENIESPGFLSGNYYENNLNCQWNISSSQENSAIRITVDLFDTEYQQDVVEMGIGLTGDSSTIFKRLSGSITMDPIVIETNEMWMTFKSSDSINKTGFSIRFEITNGECGFEVELSSKSPLTVLSPGYPFSYTNNLYCRWHIMADSSILILPNFFDTEAYYDEMEIFTSSDGPSNDPNSRLRVISGETKEYIFTDSSEIWLTFRTDGSINSAGFSLQLTADDDGQCQINNFLTEESGTLTSLNFPNSYPTDLDCTWRFQYIGTWPENTGLEIIFTDFDVENYFDYIQIGEGNNILKTLTGDELPERLVVYENIWLNFRSDHSVTGLGWSFKYQRIPSTSLGALNVSDTITSPRYPFPYKPESYSEWQITADEGKFIRLDFEEFETNSNSDWLKIGDGSLPTTESTLFSLSGSKRDPEKNIGNYKIPDTFISPGNETWITFESGSLQASSKIFSINYTAVDTKELPSGETLYLTESSDNLISSPGNGGNYYSNQVTTWVIELAYDKLVELEFRGIFRTEEGYDVLTIGSGTVPGLDNSILESFSGIYGLNKIDPVKSQTNAMWIVFETDVGNTESGFTLRWTEGENPLYECGADYLEASEKKITEYSPNYPISYLPHSDCVWKIYKTNPFEVLIIEITVQGLEKDKDVLLIGTGEKVGENIEYAISTGIPPERKLIFGIGNAVWLHFTSDHDAQNKGFEFTFYTIPKISTDMPSSPATKKEEFTTIVGEKGTNKSLESWGIAIVALGVIIGVTIIIGGLFVCVISKTKNKTSTVEIELEANTTQKEESDISRRENIYVEVSNIASSSFQEEPPITGSTEGNGAEAKANDYVEINHENVASTWSIEEFPDPPSPLPQAEDVLLVKSGETTLENTVEEKGQDNPTLKKSEEGEARL